MDGNRIHKFAVSRRQKSGKISLYTKSRFKGNRYTKLANTNNKTLSNEHVDNFVFVLYKNVKSSASGNGFMYYM